MPRKILIVGLFLSEKNKNKILRTAADQLAELLAKQDYAIIKVSAAVNQGARLLDTVFTVIFKSPQYKIAVVPFYANRLSFIWEAVAVKLLKFLSKKIVLIIHGGRLPAKLEENSGKYLRIISLADVIICPSQYLSSVLNKYGVEGSVIENVISLQDYHYEDKRCFRPRIFWMRTLEDVYNPEMAVRVAALLSQKYPGFKMVMAGYDRGSLQLVKNLAIQLSVADKIEFPGYISNEQKKRYAEELDIYICTNRIDNAPVSLIEMMAQGLPIVSVNTGGIPYLVKDGHNGLLVSIDDDEAMTNKISSIIENPELGKKLARNGLQFSRQFGEQPVMEKWRSVFKQLDYET